LSVAQIAAGTGLGTDDVSIELESLVDAGYLVGDFRKYLGASPGSWNVFGCSLSERGLRAVDAWPSESPYDPLVQMIERQTELIERQTELIERLTRVVIQQQTEPMIERQLATTSGGEALSKEARFESSLTDLKATVARLLVQIDQQRASPQAQLGLNPLSNLRCSCLASAVNTIRDWLRPERTPSDSTPG
jgi:hypothetical protein